MTKFHAKAEKTLADDQNRYGLPPKKRLPRFYKHYPRPI